MVFGIQIVYRRSISVDNDRASHWRILIMSHCRRHAIFHIISKFVNTKHAIAHHHTHAQSECDSIHWYIYRNQRRRKTCSYLPIQPIQPFRSYLADPIRWGAIVWPQLIENAISEHIGTPNCPQKKNSAGPPSCKKIETPNFQIKLNMEHLRFAKSHTHTFTVQSMELYTDHWHRHRRIDHCQMEPLAQILYGLIKTIRIHRV